MGNPKSRSDSLSDAIIETYVCSTNMILRRVFCRRPILVARSSSFFSLMLPKIRDLAWSESSSSLSSAQPLGLPLNRHLS